VHAAISVHFCECPPNRTLRIDSRSEDSVTELPLPIKIRHSLIMFSYIHLQIDIKLIDNKIYTNFFYFISIYLHNFIIYYRIFDYISIDKY